MQKLAIHSSNKDIDMHALHIKNDRAT